jgi:hypothetical protein
MRRYGNTTVASGYRRAAAIGKFFGKPKNGG